ncbi:PA3611 family quorum-sensing-regulated virulence factor [Stutzerimonas urumqiensis]|uniref:PA3611 family quorum-sensing-regulated virulence factor n=1 Tax=Stutzerimonas urumqiensis TaxID=638269 RepID=UPI000EB24F1F|nr:PA3611 family quorum-sensing-regulated virulence factor [Stutzerimonas urumqiensis]
MHRWLLMLAPALVATPLQAQSLKDFELRQTLEQVARQSSEGTPRAINENLLDRGYTVEGDELVNHIDVQPRHAAKMRDNPTLVREQLTRSVCTNQGYRQLLARGATLRYDFKEYESNRPITSERFETADCTGE